MDAAKGGGGLRAEGSGVLLNVYSQGLPQEGTNLCSPREGRTTRHWHSTPVLDILSPLPVMTSLSLCVWSLLLSRSASPTTTSPRMVIRIPSHWLRTSFRPRKATESSPVKMTTAPRSIWKLEALVMFRAGRERGEISDGAKRKCFQLTTLPHKDIQ